MPGITADSGPGALDPAAVPDFRLDGGGAVLTLADLPAAVGAVLSAEVLRHNVTNAATGGIWRVRGSAGSAILKVARPPDGYRGEFTAGRAAPTAWPTSDEPSHWNYWRRETLAYETGLAATAYADTGICGPSLLAARERADGRVELWLADVGGTGGFEWPAARLGRFAAELGAGQARWAGHVPVSSGWLSRRWLAGYLAEGPSSRVSVRATDWDHPSVAAWPPRVRHQLRALWVGQRRVLAAAQASERTLCHLDVWPANLIDDGGRSVLLDWAFTGAGALGEDPANLILDSFADGLMDAALLPEVAEGVTEGYLAGLRDGGWAGSGDAVRAAIAACGAAKYSWFAPAVIRNAVRGNAGRSSYRSDASAQAQVERLTGLVTLIAEWAAAALA